MQVNIKILTSLTSIPKRANPSDAGYDLTATRLTYLTPSKLQIDTGIALEIPEGYAGFIFPRSSIHKTMHRLCNAVAVIDSGYRGEIKLVFDSDKYNDTQVYKMGDKIAQLIILPVPKIEFTLVSELGQSARGTGGFGSTGA